jgi:hypothetical protein
MNKSGNRRGRQLKYCVIVSGEVSESLSDYYSGITIRIKEDLDHQYVSRLVGWFSDQAALLGMINLLHEWGHTLKSVESMNNQ